MGSLRSRVEAWIRDQRAKMEAAVTVAWSPPPPPRWRWPPWGRDDGKKEEERRLREEYERHRRRLQDFCGAVKAESVADLQDVLCSMVLSECVYKKPASEMIRVINKFKADFGGQVVSLERVQPSLDHVPHRYLLAEAGDTLFASFIGTKQYKDVIADANILQGVIFHEDTAEDNESNGIFESDHANGENKIEEKLGKPVQAKSNQLNKKSKPAAHRGFLARAKGIPALELYKLAQKKNQKLVLCGHSLGGAVAALATLAILRVIASSSPAKDHEKVKVKCITFSQPPVGNAALRDYVHQKGWQHYFKTYCIPEDLVPRILSPAYFHHYNAQPLQAPIDVRLADSSSIKHEEGSKMPSSIKHKENDKEQLVLGMGPVQTSFWRISRLVPLEGVWKQLDRFKGRKKESDRCLSVVESTLKSAIDEEEIVPQSLEIQEGSDGISLAPFPVTDREPHNETKGSKMEGKHGSGTGDFSSWRRVPYLPSYVPFGQLYLLGNSAVDFLSDAEYSKLTSVGSVISELRERLQSHSMKSYRSRFQKIYDLCMAVNTSPFMGMEQLSQFPHLQQWLGLAAAGAVELGHIVESPVIQAATSILPLGWNGTPGEKSVEPLKVDISGYGLHLCTLVQAQVNGNWCSTAVDSLPSTPSNCLNHHIQPDLQKMRILIGAPLRRPPKHPVMADSFPMFLSPAAECVNSSPEYGIRSFGIGESIFDEGLNGFVIYCTSDFVTVCKVVYVRTRRVRLLGLEGAGKTSLFNAILGNTTQANSVNLEGVHPQVDTQEGIVGGLHYSYSAGVNLQELQLEATRFRADLQVGVHDLRKKTDLVVLVHNLSHKLPWYHNSNKTKPQPALSLFLNEAKALGIPWVLAITNKFSVSAHQQKMLVNSVMEAYQASPSITEVTNSCPYVLPGAATSPASWGSADDRVQTRKVAAQNLALAPINFVRRPFQRKDVVMPVEGVTALQKLVHRVLRSHEESAFQELAEERMSLEMARGRIMAVDASLDSQEKGGGSMTAAAVGASLGAGIGLVLAVVMGAASALRKP